MKTLLKLEEAAQFLLCLFLLFKLDSEWWWYLLLVLGPDIGMLGYLVNARIGAVTYNLFHHKGIALLPFAFALCMSLPDTHMGDRYFAAGVLTSIILFGHSSMDRMFGYGLKFGDHFQHTHLGWIGKGKEQAQGQAQ